MKKDSKTVKYNNFFGDSVTISKEASNKIKSAVSTATDFVPFFSNVKSGVEAITGRDPITGKKLTKTERTIAASGIILPGAVKTVAKNANKATKIVSKNVDRPSWRQSEIDVGKEYPGYREQASFKDGKQVSHGTKNSSRPDFYTNGHSIEVKNYKLTTPSGRNNLVTNVSKQINKRINDLPKHTKQSVIIDVRGQNVTRDVLREVKEKINKKTNGAAEIIFKMN